MRKIFTSAFLLSAFLTTPVMAESTLPEKYDGFYRMTNKGFNEALSSKGSYNLGGDIPSPANLGSVIRFSTNKMWTFADEMQRLDDLLAEGKITEAQHTQLFIQAMNVTSWKSGFYPVSHFEVQGQEYMKLVDKFPEYADDAIEYFLNNESDKLYDEYGSMLMMLCAFATDIIKPVDLESKQTFRSWLENYLTKWRSVADFGLYIQPIYTTPEDENDDPAEPTGEYYFRFKTPSYVGSMEKAQLYINNMLSNNGENPDAEQLDIWGSAKEYIFKEVEKDYPVGSPEYEFLYNLIGDTYMNNEYAIGESEDGGISTLRLPDAFNSQEINITADDLARCSWKFDLVDSKQPLAVIPQANLSDGEGWYYTGLNAPFDCRLLSSGTEVYIANAVSEETGKPTLEKLAGDVIPANTPVIVRSKSTEAAANQLLPLDQKSDPASGNILKGVLYPVANPGKAVSLGNSTDGPCFNGWYDTLPANSVYFEGEVSGINEIEGALSNGVKIYDFLGREVKNASAKGLYIVNGKKVIR